MEEATLAQIKLEFQKMFDHLEQLPNASEVFEEMLHTTNDFERAANHTLTLLELGKRAATELGHYSLFGMPVFLWTYEGLYATRLDLVCLLLIANGHDLFNLIKRRYVSSLKEIEEVDMSTKFKFLERHKMETLVRRQDQRLRNRIAHHDFRIDGKGIISVDGNAVDIYARISALNSFISELSKAITECLGSAAQKR